MKEYAMIIDYGYCTGCKSCEISCRNEKDIPVEEWGIKINELGPKTLDGVWEWDYLPSPSRLCDLCIDRIKDGQKPSCELHCLSDVIRVVPVETVSKKLAEFNKDKLVVYVP
jgi:Fe-S-cluster-containing dehydrogenase component